ASHPAENQFDGARAVLSQGPLPASGTDRADHRQAQALQAHRAPLRKDNRLIRSIRQLRLHPVVVEIRPQGLVVLDLSAASLDRGSVRFGAETALAFRP